MAILIVAATEFEIEPFIQQKKNVDILITGVGIPATIYHLTKKLLTNKYDFVIQAGIAGTFANADTLGKVVLVKEDTFADIGIEEKENFQTLFEKGFADKNDFPFTNGWLVNNQALIKNELLPVLKGITINKLTDKPSPNNFNKKKFLADIESMEGAAFHYVCLQQKIDFLQIRSISNVVGERDKSRWTIDSAIRNLNNELIKIIGNI
jgi:futalosine hydrolase